MKYSAVIKVLALAVMMLGSGSVHANANSTDPYFDTLSTYNRTKPVHNTRWTGVDKTLKSSIQNNKKKVVGNLEDIILTPRGSVAALDVDLNRLGLGKTTLNFRDLQISSNARSYVLRYDDAEIEALRAQILANVETAAGESDENISVKSLVGADVLADDGRRIGKVDDVMFTTRGDRADALIVKINYRGVRGDSIAVPFSSVNFEPKGSRFDVRMADEQAETLLDFAKKQ